MCADHIANKKMSVKAPTSPTKKTSNMIGKRSHSLSIEKAVHAHEKLDKHVLHGPVKTVTTNCVKKKMPPRTLSDSFHGDANKHKALPALTAHAVKKTPDLHHTVVRSPTHTPANTNVNVIKKNTQDSHCTQNKFSFFSKLSSTGSLIDTDAKRKAVESASKKDIDHKDFKSSVTKKPKVPTVLHQNEITTRPELVEKSQAYKARMEKIQSSKLSKDTRQESKTSITSILFETSNHYPKEIMDHLNTELWGKNGKGMGSGHKLSPQKVHRKDDSLSSFSSDSRDVKKYVRMNTSPSLTVSASSFDSAYESSSSSTGVKRKPANPINFKREVISSSQAFEQLVSKATKSTINHEDQKVFEKLCQKVNNNKILEKANSSQTYTNHSKPPLPVQIHPQNQSDKLSKLKFHLTMPEEIKNRQHSSTTSQQTSSKNQTVPNFNLTHTNPTTNSNSTDETRKVRNPEQLLSPLSPRSKTLAQKYKTNGELFLINSVSELLTKQTLNDNKSTSQTSTDNNHVLHPNHDLKKLMEQNYKFRDQLHNHSEPRKDRLVLPDRSLSNAFGASHRPAYDTSDDDSHSNYHTPAGSPLQHKDFPNHHGHHGKYPEYSEYHECEIL